MNIEIETCFMEMCPVMYVHNYVHRRMDLRKPY